MTGKAAGKYDKKSARIDFSTWHMHVDSEMEEWFEKLVSKAMKDACNIATESVAYASFSVEYWDGKGKMPDPDTFNVELPLGAYEEEKENLPTWSFSLSEMVDRMVEYAVDEADEREKEAYGKVRDNLRKQADRLDEALKRT